MIRNRNIQLFAALIIVILTVNLVSFTTSKVAYTESYPAVVCPADSENEDSFISLASSKALVRKSGTSTMKVTEICLVRGMAVTWLERPERLKLVSTACTR